MTAIAPAEVQRAARELAKMRGALSSWLRTREINDRVLAGTVKTRRPLPVAQRAILMGRDARVEQDLANKLHALLSVVLAGQPLPTPSVNENPYAAVELAHLALAGEGGPVAMGGFLSTMASSPWLWPALIVGALLVTVTTAIRTAAEVAKDREEKACIEAGACTDYGFWLKAGGVAMLGWLFWEKLGGKQMFTKKGGH